MICSQAILPDRPAGPSPEGLARYKAAMERQNCTFEKIEILPHNIGYLKLNSFPDPSICGAAAKATMASLNHVNAIIFDLRDNSGGYPEMVMLIAAYLFDHPEYMYNPRENTTERMWTRSPVPGSTLTDKPAFVLTSSRTLSGAEHFGRVSSPRRSLRNGDSGSQSDQSFFQHRLVGEGRGTGCEGESIRCARRGAEAAVCPLRASVFVAEMICLVGPSDDAVSHFDLYPPDWLSSFL